MNFDEYLVPYDWNIDWIEEEIDSMVSLMNNDHIPEPNLSCKNCAYSEQYAKLVCNPVKIIKRFREIFLANFLSMLKLEWDNFID